MFLITNDIPHVNASVNDDGTWRRIKPIAFGSTFIFPPRTPNEGCNEFVADDGIELKMEEWKEAFIALLISQYIRGKTTRESQPTPSEFLTMHCRLKTKNDKYGRFFKEYVIVNDVEEDDFMSKDKLFKVFGEWSKFMKIPKSDVSLDAFETNMLPVLGPYIEGPCGGKGWNIDLRESIRTFHKE